MYDKDKDRKWILNWEYKSLQAESEKIVHRSRTGAMMWVIRMNVMGQSSAIVLESRYFEPLAKKIAMMLHFEVMVDGRDITLCEDRSKDARKVCLHIK